MNCMRCKDERVVWGVTKAGAVTCGPCPKCNKNGESVEEDKEKIKTLDDDNPVERKLKEYLIRKGA